MTWTDVIITVEHRDEQEKIKRRTEWRAPLRVLELMKTDARDYIWKRIVELAKETEPPPKAEAETPNTKNQTSNEENTNTGNSAAADRV